MTNKYMVGKKCSVSPDFFTYGVDLGRWLSSSMIYILWFCSLYIVYGMRRTFGTVAFWAMWRRRSADLFISSSILLVVYMFVLLVLQGLMVCLVLGIGLGVGILPQYLIVALVVSQLDPLVQYSL
jgi:hypothetical protein